MVNWEMDCFYTDLHSITVLKPLVYKRGFDDRMKGDNLPVCGDICVHAIIIPFFLKKSNILKKLYKLMKK